jgi:hypothetical protein
VDAVTDPEPDPFSYEVAMRHAPTDPDPAMNAVKRLSFARTVGLRTVELEVEVLVYTFRNYLRGNPKRWGKGSQLNKTGLSEKYR